MWSLVREGKTIRKIARVLHRSHSTISRELKRNSSAEGYIPDEAQRQSELRNSTCLYRLRLKDVNIQEYVKTQLTLGWSPELIAGRMVVESGGLKVSHEAIYQWIYTEAHAYRKYLVRQHAKRWKRGRNKKTARLSIPGRVGIEARPETVNERREMGHWESDTMVFHKQGPALQVVTERVSRLTRLRKLEEHRARHSSQAVISSLCRVPLSLRKTITYDNGRENVQHQLVNLSLKTTSYFCHPSCGWEKGTVENTIGLIRRFFPKRRTNGRDVTSEEIKKVEHWLNHRPRKCLGFKTPYEVYRLRGALHA